MKIKVKKSWDDITVSQYMALMDLNSNDYAEIIDKGICMVDIVYDVDARNISYTDFNKLLKTLDFIGERPPKTKAKASYKLNGVKYDLDLDYANFTTSQYIDFTTYRKDNDCIGMLSVVLIPSGHKYMDGYDIEKVKDDVGTMSVTDAMGVLNFFMTASVQFIRLTLNYLRRKIMKQKKLIPREQTQQIQSQMKQLEQTLGVLCRM